MKQQLIVKNPLNSTVSQLAEMTSMMQPTAEAALKPPPIGSRAFSLFFPSIFYFSSFPVLTSLLVFDGRFCPAPPMMWLRCFLVSLLVVPSTAAGSSSGSCGDILPRGCSCDRSTTNASMSVSCRQMDVSRGDFWLELSPQIESIVLAETDLDALPSGDLFSPTTRATHRLRENVKRLSLLDNRNSQQKIHLQSVLCFFPHLEELHVVNSSLVDPSIAFNGSCSHHLKLLNLTRNFARWIPAETLKVLEQMPHVTVDLRDNSFACDCNFAATHAWLIEHRENLVEPESYVCRDGYPESLAGSPVLTIRASELRCLDGSVLVPAPPRADGAQDTLMTGIYSVVIVLGVVASVVALFAFFLHFPFLFQCFKDEPLLPIKKSNKKKLLERRKYSSLPSLNSETPA